MSPRDVSDPAHPYHRLSSTQRVTRAPSDSDSLVQLNPGLQLRTRPKVGSRIPVPAQLQNIRQRRRDEGGSEPQPSHPHPLSCEMSSQPTPIPGTPPLTSTVSPTVSPKSLQPPATRHRDRSPSPMRGHLIPSPLPTRRTRTTSATARAAQGPVFRGVCKCFSRSKGHGFITPSDGGQDVFVHISDIEGEYVLVEGDQVSYKLCSIPPKHVKVQAVEVTITHLNPTSKHETWSGETVSS